MSAKNKQKAIVQKDLGNKEFEKKNYKSAITFYSNAISLDELNHVFYGNRAACYLAIEEFENARTDAKKCISLEPSYTKAYLRLALAEKKLGSKAAALKAIKAGIEFIELNGGKKTGLNEFKKLERELKGVSTKTEADNAVASAKKLPENMEPDQMLQELGRQKIYWTYKLQDTKGKLQMKKRDVHEKKILQDALNKESKIQDMTLYRRMGKAYMLQDTKTLISNIDKDKKKYEKEAITLEKAQNKITSELKDAQGRLFEFQKQYFQQQQAQAQAAQVGA